MINKNVRIIEIWISINIIRLIKGIAIRIIGESINLRIYLSLR